MGTKTKIRNIWEQKTKNQSFDMKWAIDKGAAAYTRGAKRRDLCLEKKLCIMPKKSSQFQIKDYFKMPTPEQI